eukprot:m51a1_g8937 hypothetical protein (1130) ;mRNA; f:921240-925330
MPLCVALALLLLAALATPTRSAARIPLLQSFYSVADPSRSLRYCSTEGNAYASVPVWGESDYVWYEEPAVDGSADANRVSLRVFNNPDYFLCALDIAGKAMAIRSSTHPSFKTLCSFTKVAGLSDVGLVSFVNEGRYVVSSRQLLSSGTCGQWLGNQATDVELDAFPEAKDRATWIPVDSSAVGIKYGTYYDAIALWHLCSNSLLAAKSASFSVTNYAFQWVFEKGLDASVTRSVSIRAATDMDLYVCTDGVGVLLASPSASIAPNCTFVVEKDPQRVIGTFVVRNPASSTWLAPICAFNFGNSTTSWSLLRTGGPTTAEIKASDTVSHAIASTLFGLTLDDQNFGLDGGLLAQLIRNRDFEAQGRGNLGDSQQPRSIPVPTDMRPWTASATPEGAATVGLTTATHPFDTNPVALSVAATAAATVLLKNPGYWGIAVALGTSYKGSVRAKSSCAWSASAVLRDTTGDVSTTWAQSIAAGEWAKVEFTLAGQKTSTSANFVFGVGVTGACTVWLDSFSLIPSDAVLGLFRKDVYTALAALRPSFVQFPWGRTLEGTSADTRWSFGGTVGETDARPGHYSSAWGSWSTDGLGLHEFLLLAESLAAHPILSLFAGRVVRMVEYANGAATTTYGAMRKKNGHEASFGVREVQIGSGYESSMANYTRFFDPISRAIAAAFPNITITASGYRAAQNPCVNNRTLCTTWNDRMEQRASGLAYSVRKYDDYDRSLPLVAVTAALLPDDAASVAAAAAEAAIAIAAERNADAVSRYSLAPTLRNSNAAPAGVALVALDSARAFLLPSYHVHHMAADAPCTHTLSTAMPVGRSAVACRTAQRDAVFRASNWADSPLAATFALAGRTSMPTSVSVTLLAGASPTSRSPLEVVPVTWTAPAARRVTVVLPRYAYAVVVFAAALTNASEAAPSSSSASSAAWDACAEHRLCRSCLDDDRCGWCEGMGACIAYTRARACRSDWRIDTCAASAGKSDVNTAAIVGGAVGGAGFAVLLVAVAVVVVVVARRRQAGAVPNIPIDNISVGFVPASAAFDASAAALSGSPLATIVSPAGGSSSGSSASPGGSLGVLTAVNASSLHLAADLDVSSLQQLTLAPPAFGGPIAVVPPPSDHAVVSGGSNTP